MKNLKDIVTEYICEADMFGRDLKKGDWAGFKRGELMIYGIITDVTEGNKPKLTIKSLGFWGDKSLKDKIKPTYTISADLKSLFQVNPSKEEEEALKKMGII